MGRSCLSTTSWRPINAWWLPHGARLGANAGLTLFLVDTKSCGLSHKPLVTLAKDKQSEVTFKDVRVPKANVIGAWTRAGRSSSACSIGAPRCCARRCWGRRGKTSRWRLSTRSPRGVWPADRCVPVGAAHVRGHGDRCGRRGAADVRSAVEARPGAARVGRSVAGEGVLQREVRGGGAQFAR